MAFDPNQPFTVDSAPTTQALAAPTAAPKSQAPAAPTFDPNKAFSVEAAPATPKAPDKAAGFPYDDPHYAYANVLPFRNKVDESGKIIPGTIEPAAPELVRSLARGVLGLNQRMHSPVGYQAPMSQDELGLLMTLGGMRGGTEGIPLPKTPEVPIGGMTKSEASGLAKEANVSTIAAAKVEKRAAQDIEARGTTATEVIDNLNKGRGMGKPLMLPDVLGANVTGETGRVARATGTSKETVEQAMRTRNLEAVNRVTSDINKALGDTGSYQARADLEAARKAVAAPKYKAAFSRIEVTPEEADRLNHWLLDPMGIGQNALNKGIEIIAGEKHAAREPFDPAEYGVVKNDQGRWVLAGDKRNLRLFDAVKRGYDAVVEEFRDPVTQRLKLNDYTRMVQQNRSEFNKEMRDAFPRYADALDAWGGPSQSIGALHFGEDALANSPEVNAARLKDMSESDREFAKLGLAQKLRDIANSKGPLAAEFDRLAGTKYGATSIRDKMRPFFSSDEEMKRLIDGVDYEIKMARKGNEILAGSPSATRFAEDTSVSGSDVAHAAISAATGHHGSLFRQLFNMAGKLMPQSDPEVDARIAQILTDPNMLPTISPQGRLSIPVPLPTAPTVRGLPTP